MITDKEGNSQHYSPTHAEVKQLRRELDEKAVSGEVMKRENISSEAAGLLTGFSQLLRDGIQEYGMSFVMTGMEEGSEKSFSMYLVRPDGSASVDVVGAWYDERVRRRALKEWYQNFSRCVFWKNWEGATEIFAETAVAMGVLPVGESENYPIGMYFLEEEDPRVSRALGNMRRKFEGIQQATGDERKPFGEISGLEDAERYLTSMWSFLNSRERDLVKQTPLRPPNEMVDSHAVEQHTVVD